MKALDIRLYGDPVLREKAKEVVKFDTELKNFIEELLATLEEEEGLGVAAPQVGRSLRMFVAQMLFVDHTYSFKYLYDGKTPPLELLFPLTVINPVMLECSTQKHEHSECCLSLPGVSIPVARPDWVKMRFQDAEGESHILEGDGVLAKCLQHEYDHLEGILITDYASPSLLQRLKPKLTRLKRDQKLQEKMLSRNKG